MLTQEIEFKKEKLVLGLPLTTLKPSAQVKSKTRSTER
jgi:hypothetical protein